jgi:oligopeptide/dipeptide ABC transporter ATP-binding protein
VTPLLELEDVTKVFGGRRAGATVRAVDGVTLRVGRGETLGVAGESGCGKSTLARLALRLMDATDGVVRFDGQDVTHLSSRGLLPVRRRMQAVFQDPLASFNARETVRRIMREPFNVHSLSPSGGIDAKIEELLTSVGLSATDLDKRPDEFSGGQLQRIAIARALAVEPELMIGDEPTSALDPSIQAQIINVLLSIQRDRNVAFLIISHDLDVLGHIADRLAIMYLGVVVETGPGPALMAGPLHPYTQALLSAAPTPRARRNQQWKRVLLPGDPPSPAHVPAGCRFHPRCPIVQPDCRTTVPVLRAVGADGTQVACHYAPEETQTQGRAIAAARLGHDGDPPPTISPGQHGVLASGDRI